MEFNSTAARVLSILQFIIAILAVVVNSIIIGIVVNKGNRGKKTYNNWGLASYIGSAFWCGLFFIVTSVLGLMSAKTRGTCTVSKNIHIIIN